MPDLIYRGLPVGILGEDVPETFECYGHQGGKGGQECPQCDGSHDHVWTAVRVSYGWTRSEMTVRCSVCGARCCSGTLAFDEGEACVLRRHHTDYHLFQDGSIEPVGGVWPT